MQFEDMEFMPLFRTSATKEFEIYELVGNARAMVLNLCGALGTTMTRHSFMDHKVFHSFGCK